MGRDGGGVGDRRLVTPLTAGVVVGVIGAAVAVASTFFIADPQLGVVAAIVLSFGCVAAAAGLVLIRTKNWAPASWPPDVPPAPRSVRRTRRVLLAYGVFVTAMSAVVGIVTANVGGPGDPEDVGQGWLLVGVLALVGLISISLGLRRVPAAVQSSARPTAASSGDDAEWVRLGPEHPRGPVAWWSVHAFSGQQFLVLGVLGALFPVMTFRVGVWTWVLVATVLVAAAAVIGIVLRRRSMPPSISRDATLMRVGDARFPTDSLTTAMVIVSAWEPDATARSLAVVLTTSNGERAVVELRDRGRLALTDDQTSLLVTALERSRIDLPRDKEDPKGRFSRTLYPNHLTGTEAVRMIESPPGDGDPLPVSPPSA